MPQSTAAGAAASTAMQDPAQMKTGRKVQRSSMKKNQRSQQVPGQEQGKEQGQEKMDMSKVNSRSHKKQWNKIDRYVKSNPDACPTISRLWNGTPQERLDVLRQLVSQDGVWPKIESELSWSASVGTESRSRRALLTVKQMREGPQFSLPGKIRAIVATRTPVKDELLVCLSCSWSAFVGSSREAMLGWTLTLA